MNLQFINFASYAIFILGLFTSTISRRFLSLVISFMLIIISALINFYSFSLFIYEASSWDKTFIFLGFTSLSMLLFSIIFYNYSKQTNIFELDVLYDYRLFRFSMSDWWGDEEVNND